MPQRTASFRKRTSAANRGFRASGKAAGRRRAPPSSALVDLILDQADLRDDLGGGRVLLRLGPARQADPLLRARLGGEAARMGDVAIIWDEIDDVVFRVLDGAPPPLALVDSAAMREESAFALTSAALAYIARSQSTGHS